MSLLKDVSDIFTGGLETALEIEVERARADIDNMSYEADNQRAGKGDSESLYTTGAHASFIPAGVNPLLVYGAAGLALVVVVVLILRK